MIIRPPSAQKQWDAHVSIDPAFKQAPTKPGEDASDETKEAYKSDSVAYAVTLGNAKDSGDWSKLAIEGQAPTKFVLGQVDRNIWRAIMDRAVLPESSTLRIGQVTLYALLFRLSIKSIVGWEKIERTPDYSWDGWVMAPADLVSTLDEIDPRIVGELGLEVFGRLRGVRPL